MREPGKSPTEAAGLHVLMAPPACVDARQQRRFLRAAVEDLIAGWRWRSFHSNTGRRLCSLGGGEPAPPLSISYSGSLALVLVSNDWRNVGIDLEVARPNRLSRYADIARTFTDRVPDDPLVLFVRAEAWAKAADCGFIFGAGHFLRHSFTPGPRYDGRIVRDIDLSRIVAFARDPPMQLAAAICTDEKSPDPTFHSPQLRSVEDDRRPVGVEF